MKQDERSFWLDVPGNVAKVVSVLVATCAVLLAADAVVAKHNLHFEFENWFGFYGILGLLSCFVFAVAARLMRRLVRREEDYYDR